MNTKHAALCPPGSIGPADFPCGYTWDEPVSFQIILLNPGQFVLAAAYSARMKTGRSGRRILAQPFFQRQEIHRIWQKSQDGIKVPPVSVQDRMIKGPSISHIQSMWAVKSPTWFLSPTPETALSKNWLPLARPIYYVALYLFIWFICGNHFKKSSKPLLVVSRISFLNFFFLPRKTMNYLSRIIFQSHSPISVAFFKKERAS